MSDADLVQLLGGLVVTLVIASILAALLLHGAASLLESIAYLIRLARLGLARHRRTRHTLTGKTSRTVAM